MHVFPLPPTPTSLPQKQKSQHSALYLNRYAFVSDDSWVAPGTGAGGEGRAGTADAGGGGVADGQAASCEVDVYEPTPLGGRRGAAALRVHNTMILGDHVWFQEVGAPASCVVCIPFPPAGSASDATPRVPGIARLECLTEARLAPPQGTCYSAG